MHVSREYRSHETWDSMDSGSEDVVLGGGFAIR